MDRGGDGDGEEKNSAAASVPRARRARAAKTPVTKTPVAVATRATRSRRPPRQRRRRRNLFGNREENLFGFEETLFEETLSSARAQRRPARVPAALVPARRRAPRASR